MPAGVRQDHCHEAAVHVQGESRPESEAAAVVDEPASAVRELHGDPQPVPTGLAGEGVVHAVGLLHEGGGQDSSPVDLTEAEMESSEAGELPGGGPGTAGRHHGRQGGYGVVAGFEAGGAVVQREDDGRVEGRAWHAQRLEDVVADVRREGLSGDGLEHLAGEVDAEVRVAVALTHREAEPGLLNAGGVIGEGGGLPFVVVAHRRLVGEARVVAEEEAEGDSPLRPFFVAAPESNPREIAGDRGVEVHEAVPDGDEDGGAGQDFGDGLDAEQGGRGDRLVARPSEGSERLLPERPAIRPDHGHRESRHAGGVHASGDGGAQGVEGGVTGQHGRRLSRRGTGHEAQQDDRGCSGRGVHGRSPGSGDRVPT